MRTLSSIAFASLLALTPVLLKAQACPANYSAITASNIGAASPLASGTLSVQATGSNEQPINYSVPGIGVELTKPKRASIVAGAIVGPLCLPRSDRTSVFVRYHFIVRDTSPAGGGAVVLDAPDVPIASDAFSLDSYEYPNPSAAQQVFRASLAGTLVGQSSASNQTLVTVDNGVASWVPLADCADDGAHATTYSAANHTFSCTSLALTPDAVTSAQLTGAIAAANSSVTSSILGASQTLGSVTGTSNAATNPNYTPLLLQPFSAGALKSINLMVAGAGDVEFWVLTGTFPNLTVVDRFTAHLPNTGKVTLIAGTDFSPRNVPNCYIAPYSISASIAEVNDGSLQYFLPTGSGAPASNQVMTWSSGNYGYPLMSATVVQALPAVPSLADVTTFEQATSASLQTLSAGVATLTQQVAGSSPIIVGTTAGTATGATNGTYANIVYTPLPAGTLQAISANVTAAGSNVLYVLQQVGSSPYNLAPVTSFQLVSSTTGVQSFNAGVDFPSFAVPSAGTYYLGTLAGTGSIGFVAGGSLPDYFTNSYLAGGTAVQWAKAGSNGYLQLSATVVQPSPVSVLQNAVTALTASGRSFLLQHQGFPPSGTLPAGWTTSSGSSWTIAPTGGLVSPAGTTGYGVYALAPDVFNIETRSMSFSFRLLAAGTMVGVGSIQSSSNIDNNLGTQIVFDAANNLLVIQQPMRAANQAPGATGSTVSMPLGFTPSVGVDYTITVSIDRRQYTVSVLDPISGTTVSVQSGNNNAPLQGDGLYYQYGAGSGAWFDQLAFWAIAGQFRVNSYDVTLPAAPRNYFTGDSLMQRAYLPIGQGWVDYVAKMTPGYSAISGRSGGNTLNGLAKFASEVATTVPHNIIIELGANDAVNFAQVPLATSEATIDAMASAGLAVGAKVYVCTVAPAVPSVGNNSNERPQSYYNSLNAHIKAMSNVTVVDVAAAMTTNADGSTADATKYVADGIHFNPAGTAAVFAEFLKDAPALFSSLVTRHN